MIQPHRYYARLMRTLLACIAKLACAEFNIQNMRLPSGRRVRLLTSMWLHSSAVFKKLQSWRLAAILILMRGGRVGWHCKMFVYECAIFYYFANERYRLDFMQ